MTEQHPTWLRVMQNGQIGESRAQAFLIDRFWILERSVDIQGADLFIMRRLTSQNLLDPNPPRLGLVQSKFYASSKTTQYIPKDYLQNANGTARACFFILCFTGVEDEEDVAFLGLVHGG